MVVMRKIENQAYDGDLLLEIQNVGEEMPTRRQHIGCVPNKLPAEGEEKMKVELTLKGKKLLASLNDVLYLGRTKSKVTCLLGGGRDGGRRNILL